MNRAKATVAAIMSSVSAGSQTGVTVVNPGGTSGSVNLYVVQPIPFGSGAYDGIWSGATNQGQPFAMIVGNNAVGAFAYSVAYSGGGYSCPSGSTSISLNMSTAVNGSSFSRADFSGSFQSPTQASGTLQWSLSIPGCSGSGTLSWTATKQ